MLLNAALMVTLTAGCAGPTSPHMSVTDTRVINLDTMELKQGSELDGANGRAFPTNYSLTQQAGLIVPYKMDNQWYSFAALVGDDSQVQIDRPSASILLKRGWVYLCGQAPQVSHLGTNNHIAAGAEGSGIAMWLLPDGITRRVFFLQGTRAWVRIGAGTPPNIVWSDPQYWSGKSTYVELKDAGQQAFAFTTLPSLSADPNGIRDKYEYVKASGGVALYAE